MSLLAAAGLLCLPRTGLSQTSITCGQTVTGTTTSPSQNVQYSYNGTAGQTLSFALYGPIDYQNGDWMVADIYSPLPAFQLLASIDGGSGNAGHALNLTLTNSGTFTILVHESKLRATASYSLSVQSFTGGGCDSTTITCGQTVSTNSSYNSEMDAYTYAGTVGQTLSFALYGPIDYQNGDWMVADIYSPVGQLVASVSGGSGNTGHALNLTLTNSGTFTILVHESLFRASTSYSLSVQSLTGGGCDSTMVTCGQIVTNNSSYNSEMDAYTYAGTVGQTLSFALYGPIDYQNGDWMVADIYSPVGQLVASVSGGSGNTGHALNLTLTNSGTFTILVHESLFRAAASYSLNVQSLTGGGCSGTNLPCGGIINSDIVQAAEVDAYAVPGSSGDLAIFSFSGFGGLEFDMYDPMGNMVFTCGPGAATNITFAMSGTHTLLVHASGYAATGSYGITLTCPDPCINNSISPTSVSVGLASANGTVTVTIPAGCGWTATTNVAWLSISGGASGSGNGTVSYLVAANPTTSSRVGTITIGSSTFTVDQAGLLDVDIGTPGAPGSLGVTNGVYTAIGSGEGTDGSADVFNFAYETLAGDAQIIARLQSLQGGDPSLAEAGVMIRQNLDPGSEQVSLSMNAGTNVIFRRRLATDDIGIQNGFQGTNYLWLRLMRMGNTFVAHYSTNGLDWQYMWFTTLNMSNQVQVGLAVTAHHYGEVATATFTNVSIGGLTPLSGTWPSWPEPVLLLGGQGFASPEMQRVGGFEFLVRGTTNDYFSVKGSTNVAMPFASWSALGTVTNTYGVVPFLDAQALTNTHRFYRAYRP